jgi:non-ribosomal peptide synthetase component F
VQSLHGARQSIALSSSITEALKSLGQREGVTPFMTLLAAFQTLLWRYTRQEDIIVGTDVAGRTQAETGTLIGFFANHLLLRTDLSGDPSFRELLRRVREAALGAYSYQDMPFEKLVEALKPKRSLSHTPLFQVLFTFLNTPRQLPQLAGLTVSALKIDNGMAKYDLTLFMSEAEQGLSGTFEYKADLFDAATIAQMASRFETLLESIAAQPDARLNDLCETLVEGEKKQRIIEKKEREESNFKKFKNVQPKIVSATQGKGERDLVDDFAGRR